jgi:hypothetical protein
MNSPENKTNNFESGIEQIPFTSKIELRFFRHDKKESVERKPDADIRLTEEGRIHAKSLASDANLEQSVAFASPRARTQETAGFIMAGQNDEITGEETLEELKEKLDRGRQYGSKIAIDPRLDFILDNEGPYVKAAYEAFGKGELVKFLVEQSDALANETGDTESSTYSKMAANIASIIRKYVQVAPRWNELVTAPNKKYEPVLERFLGTHGSMQECFLAKVIETTKGIEERDKFVKIINNQQFGFGEGFTAEVITTESGEKPLVHVVYKKESETPENSFKFDEFIVLELIEEISQNK